MADAPDLFVVTLPGIGDTLALASIFRPSDRVPDILDIIIKVDIDTESVFCRVQVACGQLETYWHALACLVDPFER